jgi:hypothetical protein
VRILVVDTYYRDFLRSLYDRDPSLARLPYDEQRRALLRTRFGTSDFYSTNLRRLGHEAQEVVANCEPLQRAWLNERRRSRLRPGRRSAASILVAQVQALEPDVVFVQNVVWPPPAALREIRAHTRLLAGQHATSLPPSEVWREFDLIVSSLPHVVDAAREAGSAGEYLALAFEPAVLTELEAGQRRSSVVHVGGYGPVHAERNRFLEDVAERLEAEFWGYALDDLPASSPIRRRYRGEAWGLDMYAVRAASRITLTKHISSVAGPFANNATLFEATGVGACLVSDLKDNLGDLFEVGKELVAYTSAQDCVEKVLHLLAHEEERRSIAAAGQARTLSEHTYERRMAELGAILERHLS